jgi:AcrR family transcriptional regulator
MCYKCLMTIRDDRRAAALERMGDHVLRMGLASASLRPLAAAAGTSNRMLLYYFADKEDLLGEVLRHLAARFFARLEEAGPPQRKPMAMLLAEVWHAVRTADLAPYMRLWLELAARAARGEEPHRSIAEGIARETLAWAAARLEAADEDEARAAAALLMATLDGMVLLAAVGHEAAAEAALSRLSPPRS